MKKIISIILVLTLALTLVACGKGDDSQIDLNVEADELAGLSDTYGTVDVAATKDALNPLTGLHNMPSDRVGMRPYSVSVNNIYDCWPQYGISQADVIVEMETEGGITRMMAMYADTREVPLIGSVRSLRDQFMEAIFPMDPIIVHIGTSIYADKAVAENNFRTLDGGNIPGAIYYDRARNATYATEHCKFTSGKLIDEALDEARIKTEKTTTTEKMFNFADEGTVITPTDGAASTVKFMFSSYGDGDFRYDAATKQYQKFQYKGKAQVDAGNDNKQLAFDNVLILFAEISQIDGTQLVKVNYQAGGEGYYFSQGQYQKITWTKGDYSSPFEIKTSDGSDLVLNAGISYLGVVRNTKASSLEIS
ncbi:MAG: DUF3048 domain-containing protein [Oscillospiraceae bacterium]